MTTPPPKKEGLLPINKPSGVTSFKLVAVLRKLLHIKKIGHTGTLDPFATGVMILLIGKNYTRLSNQLMATTKEYLAELHLGTATDSYDCDGEVTETCDYIPSQEEIETALTHFQGTIQQTPPMFSAKKVGGKKLYQMARQGVTIEREPTPISLQTTLLSYAYPKLTLHIACSKGTYVRSLAHDIGKMVGTCAHLSQLQRTKNGTISIDDCIDGQVLVGQDYSTESKQQLIANRLLKRAP